MESSASIIGGTFSLFSLSLACSLSYLSLSLSLVASLISLFVLFCRRGNKKISLIRRLVLTQHNTASVLDNEPNQLSNYQKAFTRK